jgi:hypothetical protein
MFLGLLQQRSGGLGDIGPRQLGGLLDTRAVALELALLELQVGSQRRAGVLDRRRRRHLTGRSRTV